MKPIGGRTLACVLLVSAMFSKSMLLSSATDVEFRKRNESALENAKGEVTRLAPVTQVTRVDPDVEALRRFLDEIFGVEAGTNDTSVEENRTFGHKRIQFMLMPMMYKMGVMMTMLVILTVISLKGLAVGVFLLVLKLSAFLAKLSGWQDHHNHQPWSPQPIHVHVHGGHPHGHHQAYSAWEPSASGPGDDEHFYYRG